MSTEDHSLEQRPATNQALGIPLHRRTWSSFSQRITSLLTKEDTHLYIDTSFLMWLTKVGTPSRTELFAWFDQTVPKRVHVPIWAAHEYLKHHTAGTLVNDFAAQCGNIRTMARRTYAELRPYIDEPMGRRAYDPATLCTDIQNTLNQLYDLVDRAALWADEYQRRAAETIDFINSHTPQLSSVYADLETVGTYADSRFTGFVPPGFQDRWKTANPYGDLLLWREILSHAASVQAKGIILITNDFKNDWVMGGQEGSVDLEFRAFHGSSKPVPRPHPMLVFEARTHADVATLELINNFFLGAYLKGVSEPTTSAFIDVALAPTPTNRDGSGRPQLASSSDTEADPAPSSILDMPGDEALFSDPPNVYNTKAQLRRALLQSSQPLDHLSAQLLDGWLHLDFGKSPFERIDPTPLADVDHMRLTATARELHEGALSGTPGCAEALADITAALERLPPNTAAALYLGFLSSMYLHRPRNEPRFPPRSTTVKRLFELQSSDFAHHAVTVVSRHLRRAQERPLYVPTTDPQPVILHLDTTADCSPPDQLASLRLDTQEQGVAAFPVELLDPVRTVDSLHLGTLFGAGAVIDATSLIEQASEIYTFPTDTVRIVGPPDMTYRIPDALSFRDPREIRIQQEPSDATE